MVFGTNITLIFFPRARCARAQRVKGGALGVIRISAAAAGRIWNSWQFEGVQVAADSSLRPDLHSESVCRRIPRIR